MCVQMYKQRGKLTEPGDAARARAGNPANKIDMMSGFWFARTGAESFEFGHTVRLLFGFRDQAQRQQMKLSGLTAKPCFVIIRPKSR